MDVTPPSDDASIGQSLDPLAKKDLYTCLEPTHVSENPLDEEQIARNVQALKNRLRGNGRRRGSSRFESGGRDSFPASE